uniref:telomere repeats-binding bouquet formation protein 2 n=1 Tax=Myodes glareolus TaxID=447135 RepID=UPI002020D2E6|nr:telomere repeats-binding bouquet formation protein 2 [Myodes glareolus]
MFQGQRGWFCRSVSQDLRQFWVDEGGAISDVQAADFLFSCDASHPDTLRYPGPPTRAFPVIVCLEPRRGVAVLLPALGNSKFAALSNKHKLQVQNVIQNPEITLRNIGLVFLTTEIRRKNGSFIWEQDENFPIQKHGRITSNKRKSSEPKTGHKKELSESAESHFISTPVVEKQIYFPLQSYPVNNMVTGYISIDALEKFLGKLHDFVPGSSGYLAYHVQNEINMSAIKNKLRRKLS